MAIMFLAALGALSAAAQSCSSYASSLVFGTYSGSVVDVTGTITVTCTAGTAYQIGFNAGNTPGSTITNRQMFGGEGGQNKLNYQLFSNAARTINWGNSSGTNWVTGTGTGYAQQYIIYARIPSNQAVPPGSYTDTIMASITGNFTTAVASFSITATVAQGCTIAANTLSFGAYAGILVNSTSTITVTCANTTTYNVGLSAGTAAGATVTHRSMTGTGGSLLSYKLFRDAARTLNWGNTVGSDSLAGRGTGTAQRLTVYGQVPGGQFPPPGTYSDTITATITY